MKELGERAARKKLLRRKRRHEGLDKEEENTTIASSICKFLSHGTSTSEASRVSVVSGNDTLLGGGGVGKRSGHKKGSPVLHRALLFPPLSLCEEWQVASRLRGSGILLEGSPRFVLSLGRRGWRELSRVRTSSLEWPHKPLALPGTFQQLDRFKRVTFLYLPSIRTNIA